MYTKRDDILRAALVIIAEYGFQGATMARIIERASVGAGTVYRYFKDKDALITELYEEIEKEFLTILTQNNLASGTVREQYLHLHQALLRYFVAHPHPFRFLDQYIHSSCTVGLQNNPMKGGSYIFRELFQRGVETGCLRPYPIVVLSALTFGPILSIARDHFLGLIVIEEDDIKAISETCWGAIENVRCRQ
jgi:AcrR family transcriptional regulator